MTLTTRVWVKDKINAHEVFFKCRELIGATDRHKYTDKGNIWNPGTRIIQNSLGQGLPALVHVLYRPTGPLCLKPFFESRRTCWLEISFDTGYAYRGDNGYSCDDLHAELVSRLGVWLDTQDIDWWWENEYTGEIHSGYSELVSFSTSRFTSSDWFLSTVEPLIRKEQR